MYIVIIGILFIIYLLNTSKETYINSQYNVQKLQYKPKEDVYMTFLGNLNDSYNKYLKEVNKDSDSPILQKALCDDRIRKQVQSKALDDAFDKVPDMNINESVLFDKSIPSESKIPFELVKKTARQCANKASTLCELTEPMLYMSQNTNFPPRWIFKPYKNVNLPKHTNLKCWDNMLNCCKKTLN
jgi:hypothetical protein